MHHVRCLKCKGTGLALPPWTIPCRVCKGSGKMPWRHETRVLFWLRFRSRTRYDLERYEHMRARPKQVRRELEGRGRARGSIS